jgi:hypothetical protein
MRTFGVVALCVAASAASGCVKRKVTVEPFQPAELAADPGSLRRAYVAMTWLGLDPVVDTQQAYGSDAPITTGWEAAGAYRTRWLIYVKNGKLHITSVCFQQLKLTTQPSTQAPGGATSTMESVRCQAQPMGRSKVAADIAAEVGTEVTQPTEPEPPVIEGPPPSPFAPAVD